MNGEHKIHMVSSKPKKYPKSIFVSSMCTSFQNKLMLDRQKKPGKRFGSIDDRLPLGMDFQPGAQTYCTDKIEDVTCKNCLSVVARENGECAEKWMAKLKLEKIENEETKG